MNFDGLPPDFADYAPHGVRLRASGKVEQPPPDDLALSSRRSRFTSRIPGRTAEYTFGNIDVLVAYTDAAENAAGSIQSLIQLAVDETNTSYANAVISFQVSTVHTVKVSYNEGSFNFLQHLEKLSTNGDGTMDELHGLRDQHLADVVVLVVNSTGLCGIADAILATQTTAFAVVQWDCATGNFTFGHEIGHLQGARHDWPNDGSTSPFQYGHGYIDTFGPDYNQFRTIMATAASCGGCSRLQRWSTPYVDPPWQPFGTDLEDNRRVLLETRWTLANFREPISVTIAGPSTVKSYQFCTWEALVGGNVPAISYQWSGVASGSASTVTSPVPQSGDLTVYVSDAYGRYSNHQLYVTVDNNAPDC